MKISEFIKGGGKKEDLAKQGWRPELKKRGAIRSVFDGRYKLNRYFSPLAHHVPQTLEELQANNDVEPFDLGTDPNELINLASEADDDQFINRITQASKEANVSLHIVHPLRDEPLNADRICEMVPDWRNADFWFCGPAAFGGTLRKDLASRVLSAQDFHQEQFEMR